MIEPSACSRLTLQELKQVRTLEVELDDKLRVHDFLAKPEYSHFFGTESLSEKVKLRIKLLYAPAWEITDKERNLIFKPKTVQDWEALARAEMGCLPVEPEPPDPVRAYDLES
jgi:hypothetical protein